MLRGAPIKKIGFLLASMFDKIPEPDALLFGVDVV
jgi:hypothetical protein